jgi:hypothetical protein
LVFRARAVQRAYHGIDERLALGLTIVVRARRCGRVRVDVTGWRVDGLIFTGIWRSASRVTANLL